MKNFHQLTLKLAGKVTGKNALLSGIIFLAIALLAITGCKKDIIPFKNPPSGGGSTPVVTPGVICGKAYIKGLLFDAKDSLGKVEVANTSTALLIKYTINAGWLLKSTRLFAGDCSAIPYNALGIPDAALFPYHKNYSPFTGSDTYQLPLSTPCYCIVAEATLVKVDANGTVLDSIKVWSAGTKEIEKYNYFFRYCKQDCPPIDTCYFKPGDFRTQTQGGWGYVPHGNNPGTYLHKNFAVAFPAGLTVGCGANTLKFTTAQAITDYLPDGGPGAALKQSYINPVGLKNVLAAQIVALSLSVQFDIYDPNFGASAVQMGNLVIGSGAFKGWTITKILAEANKVLGGCPSPYTPSQMVDVISSINENFVDGTKNNGFLICP